MSVDEDFSGSTISIKGDNNGATDAESDELTYIIVTTVMETFIMMLAVVILMVMLWQLEMSLHHILPFTIQMLIIMEQIHLLLKQMMENMIVTFLQ